MTPLLWLSLLPYVFSGQSLWVQDGDAVGDAWACQIVAVFPDHLVIRTADEVPYLVIIPMHLVRAVRERFPSADRARLETLFERSPQ